MIRPPSNQRQYDDFYSGDPAFAQLAGDATPEQKKEHADKIQRARETGDWQSILVEDGKPTKFVMRQIPGSVLRRLNDRRLYEKIGLGEMYALAFRSALVAIEGWDDHEVKTIDSQDYGRLASVDTVDALDKVDMRIVTELGDQVIRRARDLPPKS